ncbi:hypothetical protein LPJ77_000617 [Coemansia sp. RSA 2523]|nr:hypothetical protein LPJ62_006305 [Coemansia sp. RSA 2167]KAJ1780241.1 hypothetical protein LPJ54_000282 [Coemansia sp. RSA 1824]KAJ1810787.1 hypothetical protein LPJ77_000617 [Coemansia sp. RSA 2523]KAJ2429876.1 hypothetical protein GGF47_000430 [Coemansia sp. RSA 2524]
MSKLCTVCSTSVAKYKCPICTSGYCSVSCYKVHKSEPCTRPESTQKHESPVAPAEDKDDEEEEKHRLGADDLRRVGESPRVRELLECPQTRELIERVHKDADPVQAIRVLRQHPEFEQLVQAMLEATDSPK